MTKPVVVPVPVPVVAQPEQVDEDDWEWEIALARARVAAEEVEQVAQAVAAAPSQKVIVIPAIELEDRTVVDRPVMSTPIAVRKPVQTKPLATLVIPPPRPATSPPTVIPIPKLPSIKDRMSQIQPVVGASNGVPMRASRSRFAKGTGPVEPPPPIRTGEETQPGIFPAAARVVSLPKLSRS